MKFLSHIFEGPVVAYIDKTLVIRQALVDPMDDLGPILRIARNGETADP